MEKKILIIEDEKILIKILNINLLSAGYKILSASNGVVGLELIKAEKPNLILLDLLMPRMDGFEVLEAVRANEDTKNIPVFVFSNSDKPEDIERVKELGATDFFSKPETNLKDLVDKINQTLL